MKRAGEISPASFYPHCSAMALAIPWNVLLLVLARSFLGALEYQGGIDTPDIHLPIPFHGWKIYAIRSRISWANVNQPSNICPECYHVAFSPAFDYTRCRIILWMLSDSGQHGRSLWIGRENRLYFILVLYQIFNHVQCFHLSSHPISRLFLLFPNYTLANIL